MKLDVACCVGFSAHGLAQHLAKPDRLHSQGWAAMSLAARQLYHLEVVEVRQYGGIYDKKSTGASGREMQETTLPAGLCLAEGTVPPCRALHVVPLPEMSAHKLSTGTKPSYMRQHFRHVTIPSVKHASYSATKLIGRERTQYQLAPWHLSFFV